MKLLLDSRPHSAQIMHDADDGQVHVENLFDCQPAVEAARRARDAGHNPKSSLKHIGEVPMWLIHLSIREGWFHDMKRWRAILKEYSAFQVHKD